MDSLLTVRQTKPGYNIVKIQPNSSMNAYGMGVASLQSDISYTSKGVATLI